MRILVIALSYHPLESPRAHRWTAIAEHWANAGHEVQVVTLRLPGCPVFETKNGVQVHRAGRDWAAFLKNRPTRPPALPQPMDWQARLFDFLHRAILKNLAFPDGDCAAYFPVRRKTFQLLENQRFDALVSVSWPFTAHLVGLAAKRRFPAVRWLADSGDPFSGMPESPFRQFFWGKTARRLEQKIFETADAATVTTAATARFFGQKMGASVAEKLTVVPPLLHPFPAQNQSFAPFFERKNGEIHLGYFGALYPPVRTPDAFLDLLARTFARRPDLRGRLRAHFFGEIRAEFFGKMAAQPASQLHGPRPRTAVAEAMRDTDFLLNIGNQTDFQLPSKTVDYLAANRPVVNLSFVDDDPFEAFFAKSSGFLSLKTENGAVRPQDLDRWISFLETPRPADGTDLHGADLQQFSAEAIAGQCAALLRG